MGILETLLQELTEIDRPIKISIEIGCACGDKPTEETHTGILTEDSEIIQTENNENLT